MRKASGAGSSVTIPGKDEGDGRHSWIGSQTATSRTPPRRHRTRQHPRPPDWHRHASVSATHSVADGGADQTIRRPARDVETAPQTLFQRYCHQRLPSPQNQIATDTIEGPGIGPRALSAPSWEEPTCWIVRQKRSAWLAGPSSKVKGSICCSPARETRKRHTLGTRHDRFRHRMRRMSIAPLGEEPAQSAHELGAQVQTAL